MYKKGDRRKNIWHEVSNDIYIHQLEQLSDIYLVRFEHWEVAGIKAGEKRMYYSQ